jgi:hypothetical protein
VLAAGFDVISFAGGDDQAWARDFYRAASFALFGGAAVSLLAALTGFWDWKRSAEKGTQARRTVNAHAWTMVIVTALVLAGIAVRVAFFWDGPGDAVARLGADRGRRRPHVRRRHNRRHTGLRLWLQALKRPGDHPVWHPSETDVFPGDKHDGSPASW